MKSERAKKYLMQYGVPKPPEGIGLSSIMALPMRKANKIVELAEEDARERAIKAYCKSCGLSCCAGYFNNGEVCKDGDIDVFLSIYDNE
jgi:hypothetical protein